MLINSEFSIERYMGKLPLPLLSAPSGLNSTDLAQYNTFIKNIITIYASQDSSGAIPTFFKDNNDVPSINSTLNFLQPDNEYYFISKNSTKFPYSIPAIGGASVLDCPKISFNNNNISLSGPPESLYAYITSNVEGLAPGKTYNYEYSCVAANWPSKISPTSGSFIASSNVDSIDSVFSFCPASGDCSGSFPFVLDSNPSKEYTQKNIFSTIQITLISPNDINCPIMSDTLTIKCNKCLPGSSFYRPEVNIVGAPKIALSSNCCNSPVPINVNVSGTEPGKMYDFVVECWPVNVTPVPSSGSVSFGDGIGRVSTMLNMNDNPSSVVKITVIDPDNGENFVDFATVICNTSC